MTTASPSLASIFQGWDQHQHALVQAVTPLMPEHLAWRPAPQFMSVGELVSHVALARLWWFHKMGAPGSAELARQVAPWTGERVNTESLTELQRWTDPLVELEAAIAGSPSDLLRWLEATWQMIQTTLTTWTVADLTRTYRHIDQGALRAVSRQWTIWRVMSHDLHHGGQLGLLLGLLGIEDPDLGYGGGHLAELPLVESDSSGRGVQRLSGAILI